MAPHSAATGDIIINQGDKGDFFYIVETGEFQITVNGAEVHVCDGHGAFGELALMYARPRAASVIAKTSGMLWKLNRAG